MEQMTCVFGNDCEIADDVFKKFSPAEAIAKIKTYEEKKKTEEEIKVGDEVEYDGRKAFVYLIDDECHFGGNMLDGVVPCKDAVNHKTGRHFPQIAEVLEKMRGE